MPVPVLEILEWLPAVLAPLVLAQLYSTAGRIELTALFASLRRVAAAELAPLRVDLTDQQCIPALKEWLV